MIEAVSSARPTAAIAGTAPVSVVGSTTPATRPMARDMFEFDPPPQPTYDYVANNRAEAYFDPAAIYPAMDQLIASARRSIKMDFYILGGDQAMRMAQTLAEKVAAGVKVQVILDPGLGTLPALKKQGEALLAYLQTHGVEVLKADLGDLPPMLRDKKYGVIDHNKLIIADDQQALIGGMNLANEFNTFHDVMVRLDGPIAGELGRQFDYDWYWDQHPGDRPHRMSANQFGVPMSQPGLATVRVNSTGINRQTQRAAILENIQRATASIDVAMLEMGDDEVLDALNIAKNKGIKVRVMLDPGIYDKLVPLIHKAPRGIVNAHGVARLLEAGIDVRTYRTDEQHTILHEKAAIIDSQTLLVGSTNWNTKALRFNSETSVEIHGGPAPQQAQDQFDRDWEEQTDPAKKPGLLKRAASWIYNAI